MNRKAQKRRIYRNRTLIFMGQWKWENKKVRVWEKIKEIPGFWFWLERESTWQWNVTRLSHTFPSHTHCLPLAQPCPPLHQHRCARAHTHARTHAHAHECIHAQSYWSLFLLLICIFSFSSFYFSNIYTWNYLITLFLCRMTY